jgi:hypothetical protein
MVPADTHSHLVPYRRAFKQALTLTHLFADTRFPLT